MGSTLSQAFGLDEGDIDFMNWSDEVVRTSILLVPPPAGHHGQAPKEFQKNDSKAGASDSGIDGTQSDMPSVRLQKDKWSLPNMLRARYMAQD